MSPWERRCLRMQDVPWLGQGPALCWADVKTSPVVRVSRRKMRACCTIPPLSTLLPSKLVRSSHAIPLCTRPGAWSTSTTTKLSFNILFICQSSSQISVVKTRWRRQFLKTNPEMLRLNRPWVTLSLHQLRACWMSLVTLIVVTARPEYSDSFGHLCSF